MQRRVSHVVNALAFAKLLLLQLLNIAKRLHARRVSVYVATGHVPTGREHLEFLIPRFAQALVLVAADLVVDRLPRHIGRVNFGKVPILAGFDSVYDRDPLIKRTALEHTHYVATTIFFSKFLNHFPYGLLKLAI